MARLHTYTESSYVADYVAKLAASSKDLITISPTFDTRTAAQAATIPSVVSYLRTSSYSTTGDYGGALYKRVGSVPAHTAYFQSADGAYWEYADVDINPHAFGARGDGTTDDTTALNAALDYLRATQTNQTPGRGQVRKFTFQSLRYKCSGSINMTGIKAKNTVIEGNGATIYSTATGKIAVDMMNSRYMHVRDLRVWGDATSIPRIGVAMGRTIVASSSAGDAYYENLDVDGVFSLCALYNYTCETTLFIKPRLWNASTDPTSACVVMDCANTYSVVSDFQTQNNAANYAFSFNENTFVSADLRATSSGVAGIIYAAANSTGATGNGSPGRHSWIGSYIAVVNAPAIKTKDLAGTSYANFDIHVEVNTATHFMLIDNDTPTGNLSFSNMKIRDHTCQAVALFGTTGSTRVVSMDNIEIDVTPAGVTMPIFDATAVASLKNLQGVIKWGSTRNLDLGNCYFDGDIYTHSAATFTHTFGAYRIIKRPDSAGSRIMEIKGTVKVSGRLDAADVTNWLQFDGAGTGQACVLQSAGGDTNIPLTITAKGTGGVGFTTPPKVPSYTVAGVPAASSYPQGLAYISNESGGATLAFSDGTNWRRVADRAIIS